MKKNQPSKSRKGFTNLKPYPSVESQKQFYDKRWRSSSKIKALHFDRRGRSLFITSHVKKISKATGQPLRILDIGCGDGWLTKTLSKYGHVTGLDLSVDAAKKLYPQLKFIEADIITYEMMTGYYDIIVASEFIEHLTPEHQIYFIKKSHLCLKGEGYLILTTPNRPFEEKLLKGAPISTVCSQPIENLVDEVSLKDLLDPYFKVNFIGPIMCHCFSLTKFLVKYRPAAWAVSCIPYCCYRFVDKLLGKANEGRRLGIVAQKVNSIRAQQDAIE